VSIGDARTDTRNKYEVSPKLADTIMLITRSAELATPWTRGVQLGHVQGSPEVSLV
jgi:hypothetical protein